IMGSILLFLVPNMWLKGIFGLLFIYMSMFQLMPLYKHYRTMIWMELYPIQQKDKQRAFYSLMYQVTWLQTIIYTLLFVVQKLFIIAGVFFVCGVAFMYIFSFAYMRKKIT